MYGRVHGLGKLYSPKPCFLELKEILVHTCSVILAQSHVGKDNLGKFSPLSLQINLSLEERLEQVSFKALRSKLKVKQVVSVNKEEQSWQFADMPVRPY